MREEVEEVQPTPRYVGRLIGHGDVERFCDHCAAHIVVAGSNFSGGATCSLGEVTRLSGREGGGKKERP
jgi:hypothetical protein